MKAPAIFNLVCRKFIQDYDMVASTPEGLVERAIQDLSSAELRELAAFLGGLLSGKYSDDEIQQLWWSTPAEIHFSDSRQLERFLDLMKASVAGRLP